MLGKETPVAEGNPSAEEIKKLVLATRADTEASRGVRQFSASQNEEREKVETEKKLLAEQELKEFLHNVADNADGYAGFDEAADQQAFALMSQLGYEPQLHDLVIVPNSTGMGAGNAAMALMTEDKVAHYVNVVITKFGPDKYTATKPNYTKLLTRFREGTVVISRSLLEDDLGFKGTVWHECGHKLLNIKEEAGAVFVVEIGKILEVFGKEVAFTWAMQVGRKPEYHRTYGLAKDPGRKDLLLLLKQICPEKDFYLEFAEQYKDIMGKELEVSGELIDELLREKEAKEALSVIEVGMIIEGTMTALRARMPAEDVVGGHANLRPSSAKVGAEVGFAGKRWLIEPNKPVEKSGPPPESPSGPSSGPPPPPSGSSSDGPVFTLRCLSLTPATKIVERNGIWERKLNDISTFGLTETGPWTYTSSIPANQDRELLFEVERRVAEAFPTASPETVRGLVLRHIQQTSKGV